jgi:hypothetical protein
MFILRYDSVCYVVYAFSFLIKKYLNIIVIIIVIIIIIIIIVIRFSLYQHPQSIATFLS